MSRRREIQTKYQRSKIFLIIGTVSLVPITVIAFLFMYYFQNQTSTSLPAGSDSSGADAITNTPTNQTTIRPTKSPRPAIPTPTPLPTLTPDEYKQLIDALEVQNFDIPQEALDEIQENIPTP